MQNPLDSSAHSLLFMCRQVCVLVHPSPTEITDQRKCTLASKWTSSVSGNTHISLNETFSSFAPALNSLTLLYPCSTQQRRPASPAPFPPAWSQTASKPTWLGSPPGLRGLPSPSACLQSPSPAGTGAHCLPRLQLVELPPSPPSLPARFFPAPHMPQPVLTQPE